jgi:hypothetical protein
MDNTIELDKRGYWVRSTRFDSIGTWDMNTCIAYLRLPESTQTRLIGCTGVFVAKEAVSDRQLELYRQLVATPNDKQIGTHDAVVFQSIHENRSIDDDSETLGSDSCDYDNGDDEWVDGDHEQETSEKDDKAIEVLEVRNTPPNPLLGWIPTMMSGPIPPQIARLMETNNLPVTQLEPSTGSKSTLLQLFLNKEDTSVTK